MANVTFIAPIVGAIRRNDVIVVQNYSGQNAGGPTNCFKKEPPIYLADLTREGEQHAVSIEFIPINGSVWKGHRLTNFTLMGKCTLGPEEVSMYRGEAERNCGCGGKRTTSG